MSKGMFKRVGCGTEFWATLAQITKFCNQNVAIQQQIKWQGSQGRYIESNPAR